MGTFLTLHEYLNFNIQDGTPLGAGGNSGFIIYLIINYEYLSITTCPDFSGKSRRHEVFTKSTFEVIFKFPHFQISKLLFRFLPNHHDHSLIVPLLAMFGHWRKFDDRIRLGIFCFVNERFKKPCGDI